MRRVKTRASFAWKPATDAGEMLALLPGGPPVLGAPCEPDPFYPSQVPDDYRARLLDRFRGIAATTGSWLGVAINDDSTCALAVRPAPMESRHLQSQIYRLDPLLAWGLVPDAGSRAELLIAAGRRLRDADADLLLARTPMECTVSDTAMERAGFRRAGTLFTYGYRQGMLARPLPGRRGFQVRPYLPDDLPALLSLAARIDASVLSRVPGARPGQVAAFYQEWLQRAIAGEFADTVHVAVRAERPVGFLCYRTLEQLLRCTGLRVGGHGLAAVDPQAAGAIFALIAHAFKSVEDGRLHGGEFDADSTLTAYIQMLERIGLRRIRAATNWFLELRDRT